MVAAESILIDTVELIPMNNLYVGGPDYAFLPGNVGWAKNDTYTLEVANTGGKTTFVGCLNRLYGVGATAVDLPVNVAPSEADTKIV